MLMRCKVIYPNPNHISLPPSRPRLGTGAAVDLSSFVLAANYPLILLFPANRVTGACACACAFVFFTASVFTHV